MKNKQIRQWKKEIAGVIMLLLLLLAVPPQRAEAASATITISTEAEEIRVGDVVEVRLTIRADATIGDFEAFLNYDDNLLQFDSAASCIRGDSGHLKISDIGASPSAQERTYRIWFTALAQGECEIALYDRPVVYCYTDGTEMSVTGMNYVFSVLPSFLASGNSMLSALYLVDNQTKTVELSPAFSSTTKTYYAAVPFAADMVIVSAIAEDSLADVAVTGGKNLKLGNNEIFVTVTAEDGSKTTYTVYVYRAEEEEKTEQPAEEPVEKLTAGVVAEQTEEGVLLTAFHTYTVCEKPEELTLPDNYVPTVLLLEELQIPAYAKQGEPEEFLLLVLKNEEGKVNWYRYDRVEQTLQRLREEEYIVTQIIQSNDESLKAAIQEYALNQVILNFAVAFLIGICLVLLMVILWLCLRRRNRG